jgi:hypothetical protein
VKRNSLIRGCSMLLAGIGALQLGIVNARQSPDPLRAAFAPSLILQGLHWRAPGSTRVSENPERCRSGFRT